MNWWVENETGLANKQEEWQSVLEAYQGKEGDGWIRAACPMCEEMSGATDHKESLGFNTKTGGYFCSKCEAKGRLPDSYLDQLDDLVDLDLLEPVPTEAEKVQPEGLTGFQPLFDEAGLAMAHLEPLREYARGRGIPDRIGLEMGIGTGFGNLAGRIVVPILAPDGSYRGWYGRDATGAALIPHRYSARMPRHGTLWNEAQLYRDTTDPLFMVEGCLKAIPVWPDAAAFLGKPLASHVDMLRRATRPIVICMDGDAWREGQALAWTLSLSGKIAVNLRLNAKKDPDDFTREELLSRAKELLQL